MVETSNYLYLNKEKDFPARARSQIIIIIINYAK